MAAMRARGNIIKANIEHFIMQHLPKIFTGITAGSKLIS